MKRIAFVLVMISVMGVAMGQQVVNGVYQGSPSSFMYLPSNPPAGGWENSWVKPKRYADGDNFIATGGTAQPNMGSGATMGAVTTGTTNYTHRFVVTSDSTISPQNDPCFRSVQALGYQNKPILAEAWNTDLYPGTFVDSVIQMGGSGGVASGLHAQELLYSFVPDTNNPVLLLQFAFVTENALHSTYAPRNPGVEFAVLAHNTPNYLPLGNYPGTNKPYSQFFFGTPLGEGASGSDARNTPSPVMPYLVPKGSCNCSKPDIYTFPYVVVAFNLIDQARNHQAVDFRVREWACNASVHWAYCYFTAKMIPAKLQVKYCGGDTLFMSIPWGFDETSYTWYNGTDAQHATYVDINDPGNWVFPGSTSYRPKLRANPEKPYYRCEVVSRTGVPFVYEATVNYYDLQPAFTVEPKALTENKNCDLGVVVHNNSKIGVMSPKTNGEPGVDTVWQDLELHPEQCTWDFGDGTPEVHGYEPEHTYAQPGTYTIKLHITDFDRICISPDTEVVVTLLPEYIAKQYATDEATTCEGKLPYYYKPELFGYDNVQTKWDLNAVGERQVNYSSALPQYEIRAWNGCDSIVKVQFDVLTPAVTIQQAGTDFCDSAQTTLEALVSNVREEAVEYEWTFMDSVMSRTNTMLAMSDGTYSVSIVDGTTGCEASTSYKIDPCVPNIFLPNCITPTRSTNEGPAQNDYFYLDQFVQRFISEVKFMVYARNGEQVWSYEGVKNPSGKFEPEPPFVNLPAEMDGRLVLWDGTVKGRIVDGTYTYALWIVSGGQQYLYKGKLIVM